MKLDSIISSLSREERQGFIKYLTQKNKRSDTKNISLFRLLADGKHGKDEQLLLLYDDPSKINAYHALRKRLFSSLIDFMANSSLEEENSTEMQIIKLILAARGLLLNEHFDAAFKILRKAEYLADEEQLFPFLNEIYHTMIQYSHAVSDIKLDDLIERYQSNRNKLMVEDRLNIVYAKVRQALVKITYKGEVIDFKTMLDNVLTEENLDLDENLTYQSLYKLMTIVSISAFVTNDYLGIESFLLENYKRIQSNPASSKRLYYHLEVLYMIANTLFRNKKFEKSLEFLEKMELLMNQGSGKYKSRFILKFELIKSLNLNYLGYQDQAISRLRPYIIKNHPDLESLLDIYLSLVTYYFQKGDHESAMGIFSKFYHTDKWYMERAGKEWVIKKNLIEILLHIELGNIDLVESRLQSFRRSYKSYLHAIAQERVLTFLKLVEAYFKDPGIVLTETFQLMVEDSFEWLPPQREDIFVMSFYSWLKSKMEKRPLFEVTMELVEMARSVNEG